MLLGLTIAAIFLSQPTNRAPTETEQRAAYCLRVLRMQDETIAQLRSAFPGAEAQPIHDRMDAEQRALRLRYEAKLLPYLSELNLQAVDYAVKAADEDRDTARSGGDNPGAAATAAQGRMRSCRSLEGFSF